ncbi:Tfp pilus assembly protein FimT/FimU [Cyanobium sp. Morenito 9A2]|uniref:pilus assembly FimT family protein n=1 Tax=Cyanobium sp. Morenito 9A2 TaxID=2823718 RepID=UPI0020CD6021|nr:prepilin-type N-terminal cleavage/methylation domain-containing protein [Cyanobium sp. Morenito 9A2]MCP9848799.1 prepilin-type N-terminal cleavage/methylation domain-containing protein [Cyanobium sp. Morenito 9A2]
MIGPQPRPSNPAAAGFTVVELLVTVAVIGIVAGTAFTVSQTSWRREQANAAAESLYAWLQEVVRRPEQIGSSCTVTVNTGSLAPGAVLATVAPTTCAGESSLRLPAINQQDNYAVAVNPSTSASWVFTPRGAIALTTGTSSSSAAIEIRLSLNNNVPVRCIRVSGTLGLLSMGRNNTTGDTTTACNQWDAL